MFFNRYAIGGFLLMILGFFTLPFMIGFLFMPVGILLFIYGLYRALYDTGQTGYNIYEKLKNLFK